MKTSKLLGAVLLTSMAATNAWSAACVNANEVAALETAALQQELMVAAFTCRNESRYNDFVRAHRPELQRADAAVKAFFVSRGKGEAGYHTFKTELANTSAMSSATGNSFCGDAAAKFERVQGARHLGGFANALISGQAMCPGVVRSASVKAPIALEGEQVAEAAESYTPPRAEDYSNLPSIDEFDYPAYDVRSTRAKRDTANDEARPQQTRPRPRSYGGEDYASEQPPIREEYVREEPAREEYARTEPAHQERVRAEPVREEYAARAEAPREEYAPPTYARAEQPREQYVNEYVPPSRARDDRYTRYEGERYAYRQPQPRNDERDYYHDERARYADRYDDRDRNAYPVYDEREAYGPRDYNDRDYP